MVLHLASPNSASDLTIIAQHVVAFVSFNAIVITERLIIVINHHRLNTWPFETLTALEFAISIRCCRGERNSRSARPITLLFCKPNYVSGCLQVHRDLLKASLHLHQKAHGNYCILKPGFPRVHCDTVQLLSHACWPPCAFPCQSDCATISPR